MTDTPFDSIESAHEYVTLLSQQVEEVTASLSDDIQLATADGATRHLDALRLVDYKLRQLSDHLVRSRRLLNDLRALRRLLLTERQPLPAAMTDARSIDAAIEPFTETTLAEGVEGESAAPFSISATPRRDA